MKCCLRSICRQKDKVVFFRLRKTLVLILCGCSALGAGADKLYHNTYHRDHRSTPRLYFPAADAAGLKISADPEATARACLQTYRQKFNLPPDDLCLRLEHVKTSLLGKHYHYRQYYNGIPVDTAEIIVSISHKTGLPYRLYNNTYPEPAECNASQDKDLISPEQAKDAAWNHVRVHGRILLMPSAKLVYTPEGVDFRLVYKTRMGAEAPFGYWEQLVDVFSGEIVSVKSLRLVRMKRRHGNKGTTVPKFAAYKGSTRNRVEAEAEFTAARAAKQRETPAVTATVDGTGKVFDPDPRTVLNNVAVTDSSSAGTFTPAYSTATLRDITESAGTYSLSGPWVTISDFESPNTAPSTTGDGNWTAVRGNNAFNDAMTYYHIDENQRYIQSLGFIGTTGILERQIEADSDGLGGDDNSHYLIGQDRIAFGHGGVDDNEDADVILHEYGHAIQHDIAASWSGGDTGAIGEGFGDYWAGSYSYSTPNGATFYPNWIYTWDGHNTFWNGRVMNITGQYDPSETYAAHATVNGVLGDELWSTPLFASLKELMAGGHTRESVDTVVLESHFGIGPGATMPDMAQSTVAAADALFPTGIHASVFFSRFASNNIVFLAEPVLTYPAGGEYIATGATVNVTWTRQELPSNTVAQLEYMAYVSGTASYKLDLESGDTGWLVSGSGPGPGWLTSTSGSYSPTHSKFVADIVYVADQRWNSPGIAIPVGGKLSFWHRCDIEAGYDGGIVEISTNGLVGPWTDLGPLMTQNGYNGSIDSSYGNPLGDVPAFTGTIRDWFETVVELSSYGGQTVNFRFRFGTDDSEAELGWFVDDVTVSSGSSWISIGSSAVGANSHAWATPAAPGSNYIVRVKLTAPGYGDTDWSQGGQFTIGVDSDGDGLTDEEETSVYGSNPDLADSDGDEMPDGDEVVAGTGLMDSNSVFAVTGMSPGTAGARIPITFASVPGKSYRVYGRSDPTAGAWGQVDFATTEGGFLNAGPITGQTATTVIYVEPVDTNAFYVIEVR